MISPCGARTRVSQQACVATSMDALACFAAVSCQLTAVRPPPLVVWHTRNEQRSGWTQHALTVSIAASLLSLRSILSSSLTVMMLLMLGSLLQSSMPCSTASTYDFLVMPCSGRACRVAVAATRLIASCTASGAIAALCMAEMQQAQAAQMLCAQQSRHAWTFVTFGVVRSSKYTTLSLAKSSMTCLQHKVGSLTACL